MPVDTGRVTLRKTQMFIQEIFTASLGRSSYYIESNGKAAIVDPNRETEVFTTLAANRNSTIEYIFETGLHKEYVSGNLDLRSSTGARLVLGAQSRVRQRFHAAADQEEFQLADIRLRVIHSPGHTPDAVVILVLDNHNKPAAIFTGDTLLEKTVGIPDPHDAEMTRSELASMLFDSLHQKILSLPGDVIIYPASGTSASAQKKITLRNVKESNPLLAIADKSIFISSLVQEEGPVDLAYFPTVKKINISGAKPLAEILEDALQKLDIAVFKNKMSQEENLVLDTRQQLEFAEGFIPGSVFIGFKGKFEEWAGTLLPYHKTLLLVTEKGMEKEIAMRLARVGFENFGGFLGGGFEIWKESGEPIDMIINVDADEVAMDLPFDPKMVIVDVRTELEYDRSHIKQAINLPLHEMTDPGTLADFDDTQNLYLHCKSGYRSVIAASIMKKEGIHNLRNIPGGFDQIENESRLEKVS